MIETAIVLFIAVTLAIGIRTCVKIRGDYADYAGLDTLILPVVSLIVFIVVSLLTQERFEPNHEALSHRPTDDELVKGTF